MATIIASFKDINRANTAIESLLDHGVPAQEIGFVALEETKKKIDNKYNGGEKGADVVDETASGVIRGAKAGGILGLIAGVAALVIPGLGGLMVVGPIATTLGLAGVAGTTVTGAAAGSAIGGIAGFASSLMEIGADEKEAKEMETTVQSGGAVISVHNEFATEEAVNIFNTSGADKISRLYSNA